MEHFLKVSLQKLHSSLQTHMPPSPYRDMFSWAISPQSPVQQTWLQAMGVFQLIKLTETLLDGLVNDSEWEHLLPYAARLNAYLTYEVVSDNLAIGLAHYMPEDQTHELRREILRVFNRAMIARLRGDPRPAAELLSPLRAITRPISVFQQSLNRDTQISCAQAYLKYHANGLTLDDLEYQAWPALVANIEACASLVQAMDAFHCGPVFKDGLIARYQAVNHLLEQDHLTREQMAQIGADSILVMPVLVYYTAVLGEILRPRRGLRSLAENGALAGVMRDAALLVRLLNDLGTPLVMLSPTEQEVLVDMLIVYYQTNPSDMRTLSDVLIGIDDMSLLTRIRKDLEFNEFNVALYGTLDIQPVPKAIKAFGRNLVYFTQLYHHRYACLREDLDAISRALNDDRIGALALRFVGFHEYLYNSPFNTTVGEYAI